MFYFKDTSLSSIKYYFSIKNGFNPVAGIWLCSGFKTQFNDISR